ncbi:unnamed protein product, partial [Rotaria sp. Silwood1]
MLIFLMLIFHSIGRIKLCGQVNNEATLKSLGVGAVECRDLLTQKINLISSSIGTIYITVIDEINIKENYSNLNFHCLFVDYL